MNVTVKFFGPARDWAECESTTLSLDSGHSVGEAAGILARSFPKLGQAIGLRLCVNRAYVPLSHTLNDGDEIAVIPPVSGG